MINFSRLLIFVPFFMLLISCVSIAAEHNGLNSTITDEISKYIKKEVKEELKKEFQDDSSWTPMVKKIAVGAFLCGGTYLLLRWLRKKYATPEDLEETKNSVKKYLGKKNKELQKNVGKNLNSVGENVTSVDKDALQLIEDVGSLRNNVDNVFSRNIKATIVLSLGLQKKSNKYDAIVNHNHKMVLSGIDLVRARINKELSGLNCIKKVSADVVQLGKNVKEHLESINKNMEKQNEFDYKQKLELLHSIENLTKDSAEVKNLVEKNGMNLETMLNEMQKCQEKDINGAELQFSAEQQLDDMNKGLDSFLSGALFDNDEKLNLGQRKRKRLKYQ